MKKTLFLAVAVLLGTNILVGQNKEILGKWKGEWSNQNGFYFKFSLDLREDNLGDIEGEFTWKLIKSPRAYEQSKLGLTAIEYIVGTYDHSSRELEIKGINKKDPNSIIGLDVYHLKLSLNNDVLDGKTANHGTWKGLFYGIRKVQSQDKLKNKSELMGRKIAANHVLSVNGDEVIIQFWDNSQEDGDIISLNLNGEWILKNYILKKSKGEMILDLVKGENYLILHAENLGEVSPNTATLSVIEDGKLTKSIELSSDMGKSAAIKIEKL